MRISSLWRHAIPAASLAVALHAGTALACPGFPNATENCGLTFVALGQQSLGTAAEHLSLTFPSWELDLDDPAYIFSSSDDGSGSGSWFEYNLVPTDDMLDIFGDDDFERIALDIFGDDVGPDTPPPPPPVSDEPPDIESVIPELNGIIEVRY